jgi:hypothetical protein
MASEFSYACKDYPEMESCPGHFVAETEDEIWKLIELHASVAHEEDPGKWSNEDREYLKTLIKSG